MSAFLLDTHAFIWLSEDDPNLPESLREKIDKADVVYVSIASLWEIAIKLNLGKLSLKRNYEIIGIEVESSDIILLPISFRDTALIRHLPLHHRDPFDRMLVAQAMNHSLIIASRDRAKLAGRANRAFDAYSIERIW
ncbi:PilT protein domain protein [Halothece sp. PCC 7418]|uniref:type II toxin-antitoxin system VapC family toxin n=1 Tax=Halothece sp. (strain PCC 7418) TaxID=65093 RepID=UPI0002A0677D|nr:type II toxin-antitoxin system VapC family toxin [Halothece sp. PCC 7418]AFZ43686.1 PilT protein domain protein [Halothece sp. PCC 7418]